MASRPSCAPLPVCFPLPQDGLTTARCSKGQCCELLGGGGVGGGGLLLLLPFCWLWTLRVGVSFLNHPSLETGLTSFAACSQPQGLSQGLMNE